MNDELLNYDQEKSIPAEKSVKRSSSPPFGGGKLSTIFLIVLGIHVMLIIGITGFHLLRGKEVDKTASATKEKGSSSASESVIGRPMVETDGGSVASVDAPQAVDRMKMSTPSMEDPAWGASAQVQPAAPAPQASEQREVASFPPPAAVLPAAQPPQETPIVPTRASVADGSDALYTVVAGDNLIVISRKTGVAVKELRAMNNLKSDMIRVGFKLKLPSNAKVTSSPAPVQAAPSHVAKKTASVPVKSATQKTYRIVKGDTLSSVARRFHTTPNQLASINGIKDPTKISVGAELKIPGEPSARQNAKASPPVVKPFRTPVTGADMAMLRAPETR